MKARLLTLILFFLLLSNGTMRAQSDFIMKKFEVTGPNRYESRYGVSWSPDGSLVAMVFVFESDDRRFQDTSWQVYDTNSGELVNEFADLIAWSADSSRLVARRASNAPPQIMDAHTGALLGTLKDAGTSFTEERVYGPPPVLVIADDVIPNLNVYTDTLRFYDMHNGELLHSLNGARDVPIYTHDRSRFVIKSETGVQVYDASNYRLLHTLDGFRLAAQSQNNWSPDDRYLLITPQDAGYSLGPRYIWTPVGGLSAPIYNATGVMAWSPDSAMLAVPSDYTKIRLYDAESGELVETIRGFSAGPTHIEQWQGTDLVSISGDYRMTGFVLNIWDTEEHTFRFKDGIDLGYAYRVQGDSLDIFEPFRGLRQINLSSGEMIREVAWEQPVHYLSPDWRWAISPDYSVEDGLPVPIHLYRTDPFELVATVEGNVDMCYAVWSPDSRYFASIGQSPNTVSVWEIVGE